MKRIISFAFAAVLSLSFAAVGFAQQEPQKTEKKPAASTEHKTMTEHKAMKTATETVPLNKDEIMVLQNALIKAKIYTGAASGLLDKATKSAIQKYQTEHKLQATGEPNPETLHMLGVVYAAHPAKPAARAAEHPTAMKKEAGKKPQ